MGAKRDSASGVLAAGVPAAHQVPSAVGGYPLDLTRDAHVHTGFAAGRDSVGVVVTAADRAGLSAVTFADQVCPDTTWLAAYADAIRRAQQRTEMALRVAAEIEVVRLDGWLGWPADLSDVDALSIALSRLPVNDGFAGPREVRAMLASGALRASQVAEMVVDATVRAMERASRYAPAQLARPLSLLAQVGLTEADIDVVMLDHLVNGCRATSTAVEISEAWRSPSVRLARLCVAAGVPVLAASDARYAAQVGRWQYVNEL